MRVVPAGDSSGGREARVEVGAGGAGARERGRGRGERGWRGLGARRGGGRGRGGRGEGLLDGVLDGGGGEGGLAHDAADGGIVEDGEHELLQLDLDGEERLLRRLRAAPALLGLRALERRDERVGHGRRLSRPAGLGAGRHGGQPVERDGEAELESAAVERVRATGGGGGAPRGGGPRAGLAEQAGRRGEERGGDVERRGGDVPPSRRLVHGSRQRGGRVRRERLLDGAEIRPHGRRRRCGLPLMNRSEKSANSPVFFT